jgi:hypothetical protein
LAIHAANETHKDKRSIAAVEFDFASTIGRASFRVGELVTRFFSDPSSLDRILGVLSMAGV